MKTLLIMRHGKSSWKDAELQDMDRPLNQRGRKDSARMGKLLNTNQYKPDLILCSPAIRARQTAEILINELGFDGKVEYPDSLYMAEADTIVDLLQNLPNVERVLVIGHNPGLETLVQLLTNKIISLPTASIAHVKLPVNSWQQLGEKTTGEIANLWLPKE